MAASLSGTSMTPSSRRSSIGSSLSDDKPILIGKVCLPGWKWRRGAPPFLAACGNGRSRDLTIETPSFFDDFCGGVISKDSSTLLKPLTTEFSNSVADGSRLRVAYQGVPGSYSELAAEKAYPNCEAVPFEQFDTAFEAVESWLVDRAVLPFENSGGRIQMTYDLLLQHSLYIVGEVKLAIRHCLMANHRVEIEDLNRVLSHPQNYSDNVTRFHMLAKEPLILGTNRPFKTSIVFSLEEGPGVLLKALAIFALRSIKLTKIESHPLPKQPLRSFNEKNGHLKYFECLFYVDFKASMADPNAQNALRHLKKFATFLRVLGSYPVGNSMDLVEELVNLLCCANLFDMLLTPNSTQHFICYVPCE